MLLGKVGRSSLDGPYGTPTAREDGSVESSWIATRTLGLQSRSSTSKILSKFRATPSGANDSLRTAKGRRGSKLEVSICRD